MYLQPDNAVATRVLRDADGIIPARIVRESKPRGLVEIHAASQASGVGTTQAVPLRSPDRFQPGLEPIPNCGRSRHCITEPHLPLRAAASATMSAIRPLHSVSPPHPASACSCGLALMPKIFRTDWTQNNSRQEFPLGLPACSVADVKHPHGVRLDSEVNLVNMRISPEKMPTDGDGGS
jgi:hypothetical protein